MIDFYTAPTPNGYKISIALEEMGIDYKLNMVDFTKKDQHQPDYRK